MFRRKYKFTDKKHSRQGILSSGIGMLALFVLAASLWMAYAQNGQAGRAVAVTGEAAFILMCLGLYFGIRGMGEEDVYRLFPWFGCTVNGILFAAFVSIYALGW